MTDMLSAATGTQAGDDAVERTIRHNDRTHVLHSWSAQAKIDPLPVEGGSGSTFWDYQGNSYLDFGAQLVNLNLGHQHPDLVKSIQDQAGKMATIQPAFANDVRGELAALIASKAPGTLNKVFFTNGGAEANENAVRMARAFTGKSKILAQYRSYHGATSTAMQLTGDPRRWANEPGAASVAHFFGPYAYRSPFHSSSPEEESARALEHLESVIVLEGASTIGGIIIESVVGTNGILVPPPGYLPGVRALCDKYGIVYIADEVMAGFGRIGEWFAVDAFDVVPDLISFAKGVNSGYVPLGGVVMSDEIAAIFDEKAYPGGLTYSGHPLACAPGVATFKVFERDGILAHVRDLGSRVVKPILDSWLEKHPSVGEVRGQGLFWAVELVTNKDTREPLVPFNAAGEAARPMAEVVAACKARGVWPMTNNNRVHICPPLVITEAELRAGLAAIDEALTVADGFVR